MTLTDDIAQRSDEWYQLRLGKVTASRVVDVVAKTAKSGYSASRSNYAAQLIAERLTGIVEKSYVNAAMQHGIDTEPEARAAYEFYKSVTVEQIAFMPHPTIDQSGASPDGLVGDAGMLECKCPQPAAHLETLRTQKIPEKYVTQMLWQLACSERRWVDYVSYSPSYPEHLRLWVKRIHRDDARIAELEKEVIKFLSEIDATIGELNKLYAQEAA